MRVIGGKLKLTWREGNAKEVAIAEKAFKEYVEKGWLAIGEKSGKKTQIFTFDQNLETIVLSPIIVGG